MCWDFHNKDNRDRSADGVVALDPSFGIGGKVTSGFSGDGNPSRTLRGYHS